MSSVRVATCLLDRTQHLLLRALGKRPQRVRSTGNHRLAHRIRPICDQLEGERSTSASAEHVYRLTEVIEDRVGMPFGNLSEADIRRHSRPSVGEVDLETGPGQRIDRSQREGSLNAGLRVAMVWRRAAQIDQRLAGPNCEVGQTAAERPFPNIAGHHGLILLRGAAHHWALCIDCELLCAPYVWADFTESQPHRGPSL